MADPSAPDREAMRALAAQVGDRANALAAQRRVAEVSALWENAIAGLSDESSQALITLAYAWYQALHGEVEHGVRLAADLRDCAVSSVRAQVRVLVRHRVRIEPEVVEQTWRAATGIPLPAWASLSDADIDAVAEWIAAAFSEESRALYDSLVGRVATQDIEYVLDEIVLGDVRLRAAVSVHRAVLVLGGDVGYRCLGDLREVARAAGAAIVARDWNVLRACGTIELIVHGRAFLGGVHGVIAELMATGDMAVSPAMAERVAALARDAQPWERRQVAVDLAATGEVSMLAAIGGKTLNPLAGNVPQGFLPGH